MEKGARAKVSMRYNRGGKPSPPPAKPAAPAPPPPTPAPKPSPAAPVTTAPPTTYQGGNPAQQDVPAQHKESQWGLTTDTPAFSQEWGNYDWSAFQPNDFGFSWEMVPDYMRGLEGKALVMMMMKKGLIKGKKKKKKKFRKPVDK